MILVDQEKILSCFARVPAVLKTLHKLYSAIACEKFLYCKAESLFCTVGIPLYWDKIFPSDRFSPPKRDEKVI